MDKTYSVGKGKLLVAGQQVSKEDLAKYKVPSTVYSSFKEYGDGSIEKTTQLVEVKPVKKATRRKPVAPKVEENVGDS